MKLVADNLRITKPAIQKALKDKDPSNIMALAKVCTQKGAWAIDVNTGPLGRDPEEGMLFFMDAVQQVSHLPLAIDTTNPKAMETGLAAAKGRAIINGFALETKKIEKILPLAKAYDADIVGFLLYPNSRVPKDANERFEIALALIEAAEAAGVAKERVIIDPVVPPLAWENGIVQAREVLTVIQTLPDLLGFPVRTIAGISNLATRVGEKEKKRQITQSYLSMLAAAGLSYALMDILDDELVKVAKTANILASEDLFSWGMVPE